MTVYVDDARLEAPHLLGGRARWSHLTADTLFELEAFARRLRLNPSWLQDRDSHLFHYDVTDRVRQLAIGLGAEAVDPYELVRRRQAADGHKSAIRQLGWLPTLELVDGRQVVALDDLAETIWSRLEWPVVELADGRLAVLVDDLIAGGVVT